MYNCVICGIEILDTKRYINHLRGHKYRSRLQLKDLYDLKIKKPEEDVCTECGDPNKFINFFIGYNDTCSHKCATKKSFKNPDNYQYERVCSKSTKQKLSNMFKGRKLPQSGIDKMREKMILRGKEGTEKARSIKEEMQKQLKNCETPIEIRVIIDSYKENDHCKLLNSDIKKNQCIFCNEIFDGGSGLQTHLLFKHHYSDYNFYVNYFFYKKLDGKNHCIYCDSVLGSGEYESGICNSIGCMHKRRSESWFNRPEEERKLQIKKANVARAISSYRHNEDVCNMISVNSIYNDPDRRGLHIEKQSKLMSDKIQSGEFSPWSNFKRAHEHFNKCENHDKLFCRSGLEYSIFKIVDTCNDIVSYQSEVVKIQYIDNKENCNKYTIVDMLIKSPNGSIYLGEIKPWEYLIDPEKAYDTLLLYKMIAIRDYSIGKYDRPKLLVLFKNRLIFVDITDYLISFENRTHIEYLRINYNIDRKTRRL